MEEKAKEEVEDEFKELKKDDPSVKKTGMLHLAKLRAHGFELTVEDHVYLTKHIANSKTAKILAKLNKQAEGAFGCDVCVLEQYLIKV